MKKKKRTRSAGLKLEIGGIGIQTHILHAFSSTLATHLIPQILNERDPPPLKKVFFFFFLFFFFFFEQKVRRQWR